MQCPALESLRGQYESTLAATKRNHPHSIFLPVIYKHPQLELMQFLHDCPFSLADFGIQHDGIPTFYTDGAPAYPSLSRNFLDSYAIVVDTLLAYTDQERMTGDFRNSGRFPPTLLPVTVAQVSGLQTINRAEFSALILIAMSVDSACIYSDSQWALDTFAAIQRNSFFPDYVNSENSDLIYQLCQVAVTKDLQQFSIRKIKSHLEDDDVLCNRQLYHVFGNPLADMMAGRGISSSASNFNRMVNEIAQWYQSQLLTVQSLEPCLIAANQARLDAQQQLREKA